MSATYKSARRELTGRELDAIRVQENAWFPEIIQHRGTPAHRMMSSPSKGFGLAFPVGFGFGAMVAIRSPKMILPVGLLGASLFGAAVYSDRKVRNGNILEVMRRLPAPGESEWLTKHDYHSDPVVQKDREIQATHAVATAISNIPHAGSSTP